VWVFRVAHVSLTSRRARTGDEGTRIFSKLRKITELPGSACLIAAMLGVQEG
jgi:hypothetical protein